MKYGYHLFICLLFAVIGISCNQSGDYLSSDPLLKPGQSWQTWKTWQTEQPERSALSWQSEQSFFGDSTLTIISSNRPNGYLAKLFISKDLILLNLTRGDSINQYIPIHELPYSLVHDSDIIDLMGSGYSVGDSIGTYVRYIHIPVEKEKFGWGLFFMDVNFDGEEELLIEHSGYNRVYYACFDIVHGKPRVSPGFLNAMEEEPFNNLVAGSYGDDIYTEFDFANKTIHIFEQMGCCSHVETWCKLVADSESSRPSVKVVRREEVEQFVTLGTTYTKVYVRENGKLVLKEEKEE